MINETTKLASATIDLGAIEPAAIDFNIPLQTLFDDVIEFISVSSFS